MVAALVLLFLIGSVFSFGNVDAVALRVKDFFKDVDIGNTGPEQKLEVTGNILASSSGNIDLTLNSITEDDAKFSIKDIAVAGNTARLDILGSASQVFMSIASSGNVGIGTTTADANLKVVGNNIWLNNTQSMQTALSLTNNNTGQTNADGFNIALNITGAGTADLQNVENTDMGFYTNNSLRFLIEAAGTIKLSSTLGTGTGVNYLCINTTTFEVLRGNGLSCTVSSIRFKENVQNLNYGLSEVLKLRPVSFTYKSEGSRH